MLADTGSPRPAKDPAYLEAFDSTTTTTTTAYTLTVSWICERLKRLEHISLRDAPFCPYLPSSPNSHYTILLRAHQTRPVTDNSDRHKDAEKHVGGLQYPLYISRDLSASLAAF